MRTRLLLIGAVLASGTAMADQKLAIVGSWSGLPLHKQYEAPFWNEKLPAASGGKITAILTTHDQMGIQGSDVYRMLGTGVFDVGMTVADYAVSDSVSLWPTASVSYPSSSDVVSTRITAAIFTLLTQ